MICIFNVPTSSTVLINGGMEEKKKTLSELRKKVELKRWKYSRSDLCALCVKIVTDYVWRRSIGRILSISGCVYWLIDWIVFYAVSTLYQPCNGGWECRNSWPNVTAISISNKSKTCLCLNNWLSDYKCMV